MKKKKPSQPSGFAPLDYYMYCDVACKLFLRKLFHSSANDLFRVELGKRQRVTTIPVVYDPAQVTECKKNRQQPLTLAWKTWTTNTCSRCTFTPKYQTTPRGNERVNSTTLYYQSFIHKEFHAPSEHPVQRQEAGHNSANCKALWSSQSDMQVCEALWAKRGKSYSVSAWHIITQVLTERAICLDNVIARTSLFSCW